MNVRNFWVRGRVDGNKDAIGFGPRSKDGGFYLDILMRDDDEQPTVALHITGIPQTNGDLVLTVRDADDRTVFSKTTYRADKTNTIKGR